MGFTTASLHVARRYRWLMMTAVAAMIAGALAMPWSDLVIYNASPSMPIGLYARTRNSPTLGK